MASVNTYRVQIELLLIEPPSDTSSYNGRHTTLASIALVAATPQQAIDMAKGHVEQLAVDYDAGDPFTLKEVL